MTSLFFNLDRYIFLLASLFFSDLQAFKVERLSYKEDLGGLNGVYLISARKEEKAFWKGPLKGIFKPCNQEAGGFGNPEGQPRFNQYIDFGQLAIREVIAYQVQQFFSQEVDIDFRIPYTDLRVLDHKNFGGSALGSFQEYIKGAKPLLKMDQESLSSIPVEEFQVFCIDILLVNTDRHLGNVLMDPSNGSLVLIDNGACLPNKEGAGDTIMSWSKFPQAKLPLREDWSEKILNVSIEHLMEHLEETLRVIRKEFGKDYRLETSFSKESKDLLRAGMILLKVGIKKKVPLGEIAKFMLPQSRFGRGLFASLVNKYLTEKEVDFSAFEEELNHSLGREG